MLVCILATRTIMETTEKTAIELLVEFLNQIRNSPTPLELRETVLGATHSLQSVKMKLEIGLFLGRLMHPSCVQREHDVRDGKLEWLGQGKHSCSQIKSAEHEARLLLELFCGLFGMMTFSEVDTSKRSYASINYSIGEDFSRLCARVLDNSKNQIL